MFACLYSERHLAWGTYKTLLWIDRLLDLLHYITMVRTLQLALHIRIIYEQIKSHSACIHALRLHYG